MHRLPARAALYASSSWSSAKAHVLACRLARRVFLDTATSCVPLRRLRRLVRSRMPVSASSPMKAEGMVARMRLLMMWLVFSLSRLSRWRSHDAAARGAASALSLKAFLQAGVMVRPRSDLLSRMELGSIVQGGYGSQVPAADIDAHDLVLACWGGIRHVDGHRDQQKETRCAPVIPEFGPAQSGPCLEQRHMARPAEVGDVLAPRTRQQTHLLPSAEPSNCGPGC